MRFGCPECPKQFEHEHDFVPHLMYHGMSREEADKELLQHKKAELNRERGKKIADTARAKQINKEVRAQGGKGKKVLSQAHKDKIARGMKKRWAEARDQAEKVVTEEAARITEQMESS